MLLLKQTLDTPYDPGPLQLSGPNVDVTAIEQVLSRTSRGTSRDSFQVGVTFENRETVWTFGRDTDANLQLREMSVWLSDVQDEAATLREGMTSDQLRATPPGEIRRHLSVISDIAEHKSTPVPELAVARDRCFLVPRLRPEGPGTPLNKIVLNMYLLEEELSRVIHLPALRGNPRRTYPTAAVEDRFPGRFETYTGDTEIATAELDEAGAFGDWPEDFDEVQLESESRYLDAAAEAGGA